MERIKQNKLHQRIFQPPIKQLFYFDLIVFIFVFFITLLANFTERSIQFNIVVSMAFLVKCIVGGKYRNHASFVRLRLHIITRLAIDICLILPIIFIYKINSATYTYNYIIVIITLVVSEIFVLVKNSSNLYTKTIIESIE